MRRMCCFTVVALASAAWAVELTAQTALSVDGIVESRVGGFKFPDATVQLSAATGAEVRTPIDSLPRVISASGSYYLSDNLTMSAPGDAITILAHDVTVDLMGFILSGDNKTADNGIYMDGRVNVEIRNGTVVGFKEKGIWDAGAGYQHRIIKMRVQFNGGAGVLLGGSSSLVQDCTAADNGSAGIQVSTASLVTNSTARNNGAYGIRTLWGSTVIGSTSWGNAGTGISVDDGSTAIGNSSYANEQLGIEAGSGSTVSQNSVTENDLSGISVADGSLVSDNAVRSNNKNDNINGGGIRATGSSLIKNNVLDKNKQTGIRVSGSGAVIEENLLTGSTNGITFWADGNYFANNRASGNSGTDYDLKTTTQTDGGGNVSF